MPVNAPTLNDLKKEIGRLHDEAHAMVTLLAEEGGRDMTPDETARFESLIEERGRLQLEHDQQHRDTQHAAYRSALDHGNPDMIYDPRTGLYTPDTTMRRGVPIPALRGSADRSMTALFGPPRRAGWQPGQWWSAVSQGLYDPRLQMASAMQEGVGTAGGFMVPEELAYAILDQALHQEIVRPRARLEPMSSRTKTIATYNGTNQSQGLYGFTYEWLAEGEEGTQGTGLVRALELTARVLAVYVAVSMELEQDAPNFESNLRDRLAAGAAEALDFAYLRGTGAGQPLGVLNSAALLTIPKEASQAAPSIIWANLTKMFAAHSSPQSAVWVINPSSLPAMVSLMIKAADTDTAGAYVPAVSQAPDGSMTLLTRPLLLSSKMPVLGQVGDVLFADFSAYAIGLRREITIEKSNAPGWMRREESYRMVVRSDGQPTVNEPYTGRDGRSYSPFVALAARP